MAATPAPDPAAVPPRGQAALTWLATAGLVLVLLAYFAAIGLPPNPLGAVVQDWFLDNPTGGPGTFDSRVIVGAVSLALLLVLVPAIIGLLLLFQRLGGDTWPAVPTRPAALRARSWRRASAAVVALSLAAFGLLLAADATGIWAEAPVEVRAEPRAALRSALREQTRGAGRMTDTRTFFSGVGEDFATGDPRDELVVPLVTASWRPGLPLELFWYGPRSRVPWQALDTVLDVPGTLHRGALPRYVVNSYRRAGLQVADGYEVLEPEPSALDRELRPWGVLVVGLAGALTLLAGSFGHAGAEAPGPLGPVSRCATLQEVLRALPGMAAGERPGAAAFGMVLAARLAAGAGGGHAEAAQLVAELARARQALDAAAGEDPAVASVTASILRAVQAFADAAAVGATEWASAGELARVASQEGLRFAPPAGPPP